jgi:hypothetical protein
MDKKGGTSIMKYWYDTEFIEDGLTIDLISIGIVAEDGREYYAQSVEFDQSQANIFVQEQVLPQLVQCPTLPGGRTSHSHIPGKCHDPACTWRSLKQIAEDIEAFCEKKYGPPELWGYFSAYDHVALCQLWGPMSKHPDGFPMYTRDLKQLHDDLGHPLLPEKEAEHHALADARWNKQAYDFLIWRKAHPSRPYAILTDNEHATATYSLTEGSPAKEMLSPVDPMVGWYDRLLAEGDEQKLRMLRNIPRVIGVGLNQYREHCIRFGYGSRETMDILFPEEQG